VTGVYTVRVTSPPSANRRPIVTSSTDVAEPPDDLRSLVTLSRTHPTDIGERHVYVKLDNTKVRLATPRCAIN
jgi:hypothetical protein